MSPPDLEPKRRSSWSFRAKVARAIWGVAWTVLGLRSATRVALIRLFGGKVGRDCRIGRRVEIAVPWNVRMGDRVEVGDEAILYSLGRIVLRDGVRIDVRAHLCAGTHDHRKAGFPLVRSTIEIGTDARIGAASFIGPSVRVGARSGVAAQAVVFRDVPDDVVVEGNPAAVSESSGAENL
jgi:putative colanic acid biosynthesis acetyltransferase WcaF